MTREDLQRCDLELTLLVTTDGASDFTREAARSYNAHVGDVRAALLEPARDLLGKGVVLHDLAACLEKAVAELAFWRRVLVRSRPDAFGAAPTASDCLLRYLMS